MDLPLETCPICKRLPIESGFLYCKVCYEQNRNLCLNCLRAEALPKLSFCSLCESRKKNIKLCDKCKTTPPEKGELLCGSCWRSVNNCPLCKIEKLPKRWNSCKKCFHAGNRLCLKCKSVSAFPGKKTCNPCEAAAKPAAAVVVVLPPKDIKEMSLAQFLQCFEGFMTNERTKIVFFVGAGCSISSGIPAASRLVLDWNFPAGTPYIGSCKRLSLNSPDSDAITKKFPLRSQRGEEFWRLCHEKQPSQGYHGFATLIRRLKPRGNLILTTNFDHMIRRALPEVLDAGDPYSAQFAPWWLDHNTPLHGDYTKIVANTQDEMYQAIEDPFCREKEAVPIEVSAILRPLMQRKPQVLIVMGYSGSDHNIRDLIAKTDLEIGSVYWINGNKPTRENSVMYDTLLQKQVTWVNHLAFDTFIEQLLLAADRVQACVAPAAGGVPVV